ncbi:MAG: 3-dehydroquinate synthase [Anaerolineales bacterium]|nr:3-dehydroquinate synthase [Anaerolineales bacterium]
MKPFIFLYGPSGSGKSTIAPILARSLDMSTVDLDQLIVQETGQEIPQIFEIAGEPAFRQYERHALQQVLAGPSQVVSLGGGALQAAGNRDLVEAAGVVICLSASVDVLIARLQADVEERPLLAADLVENLEAMLQKRKEHYASFSYQLDTSELTLEQAAHEIQIMTGLFHISGMGTGYPVQIGAGSLAEVDFLQIHTAYAIVSDENVSQYHLDPLLAAMNKTDVKAAPIVIPSGEQQKSIDTAVKLWEQFLQAGLDRKSAVLALGGGVVGDLTGFAAAAYMRGIAWVSAPTSLLAMVDSSLGGKTGVNLAFGKNLVGAFYPPEMVVIDPALLETLPQAELINGMAEVVKHGVIADPVLFEMCARPLETQDWEALVRRAAAVKIRVVNQDPYEQGLRETLNFGHTVGHAIEALTHYGVKHGEAVAIGMVIETRLAENLGTAESGLTEQIIAVLEAVGLPTELPASIEIDDLLVAMQSDKKKRAGRVRFSLPVKIGEAVWGVEVEDLKAALAKVYGGIYA